MKYLFLSVIITLLISTHLFSQSNYLNNDRVYHFLERLEVKGLMDINHHQKPYSRQLIAKKLDTLRSQKHLLNEVEKDDLEYYSKKYSRIEDGSRSKELTFLGKDNTGLYQFFSYKDSLFNVNFQFEGGIGLTSRKDKFPSVNYWNGFNSFGSIGENFSYDLKFNDYSISNYNEYPPIEFSPRTGTSFQVYRRSTETFNHDRTIGNITYSWNWGEVSLIKDYNFWGTGYNGNIILSDKAPSFPHLRFKFYPVDWLEFSYIHGELNSTIFDSSTYRGPGEGTRGHIQLVDKYYAAHMLTIDPLENLKVSVGESVVYSDQFEPIYLIPVLFFRIADHYKTYDDPVAGNAQLFASLSYRIPGIKARFDASLFIDELSIAGLVTDEDKPQANGYSLGLFFADVIMDNLDLQIEYTKLNPFAYQHSDAAQTYYSYGYQMGHWIGSNADQLFARFIYTPFSKARISSEFEYTRRGNFVDISEELHQKHQTFLFGNKSYYLTSKISFSYEVLNNLVYELNIAHSNAWGENNELRVKDYKFLQLSTEFKYGF